MSYRAQSSGRPKRSIQIEARERKICTIAFIDIVQSTALIEDLDPEDALDRLGPAVEMIMDTCEEFGASVRFVGDGALAVFGFPSADENHCIRAVEAGLTAIERVSEMKTEPVNIRVGIHSGPVLFGSLSHSSFDELTLTGPVVNLADKIQSAAKINTVTASQTVVDNVREMFLSRAVGDLIVSGTDHPLPLFEITDRDETVSRWKIRVGRGLSPFTGRDADLGALHRAWHDSLQGKGSAIAIVGEAGIGKSRLLHEFTGSIERASAQVLEISATALDKKAAYAPITRAIKQRLGLSVSDSPEETLAKVGGYLDPTAPEYQQHISALKLVLHSASDDPAWAALGPKVRQETIVSALLTVVRGMAGAQPMAVIFEDMHWVDKYTLALCLELARTAADSNLLVLLTSRVLDGIDGTKGANIHKLHLGPLEQGDSRDLIGKLLNRDGERADLSTFIERICGQTPLFIEEIIRNLKTVGISKDGSLGAGFSVPESVQPLIAQRIDALPPARRETLQIASIIGSEFSTDLLQQLLRKEGLEDTHSLAFLAKLDLLQNVEAPTAKFRHALIQQVAYATLPKRRLRHLHGMAFEILKGQNLAANLSAMSSRAFHAERSLRWIEAAEAYILCGHLALERAAFDDGIMHFDKAIVCAEHLDAQTPEAIKLNMQARQGLRVAYVPSADFSSILRITGEVETLADALGDDASRLGAGIDQVIMRTILSDVAAVIPKAEDILAAAVARGAPGYIATAAFALSQAHWFTGRFDAAVKISRQHAALYVRDNDRLTSRTTGTVSVLGMGTYANALSMLGSFDEARQACNRMATLAHATAKPYDIAFQAISVGIRALQMGNFKDSRTHLEFASNTSEVTNIDVLRAFLSASLARACAGLGDFEAALAALAMGKAIAQPAGMSAFLAHLLAAEIDIFDDDHSPAQRAQLHERLSDMCKSNGYGALIHRPKRRDDK